MKTKVTFAMVALSSLALLSCQKINVSPKTEAVENHLVTLTCRIADTKLAIDSDGKTTWEVGDQIFVHGEQGSLAKKGQVVTLAAEDIHSEGKTATITFNSENVPAYVRGDCRSTYYACYPATAVVPNWYMYYYGIFNNTNLPLMLGCDDGNGQMIFRNLCSALSFKIDGDYDSYMFSGNSGETVGWTRVSARLALRSDGVSFKWDIPYDSELDKTLKNTGELTSLSGNLACVDGTADNFIYFFNGVNFTDGFTIKFLKGGNIVKTLSTHSAINLERDQYRPLGDITSYLKDYVGIEDVVSSINASTDLSAKASANCYLLDASDLAGDAKYKFKAVKGNSSTSVGTIASVEVLWETFNNTTTPTVGDVIAAADYSRSGEEQYIHFQLPASIHAGNALVAAKNAGGDVIWSWHIWIASSSINTVEGITKSPLMDRNLGALSVTIKGSNTTADSFGLFYQWGRKDPFPGPGSVGGSKSKFTNTPTFESSPISSSDLVKHPTVFYTTDDSHDFLDVSDGSRWGAGSSKTINDPCPAGYRIPEFVSSDIMWQAMTASQYSTYEYSTSEYWFKVGDAIFPITGYNSYAGNWFSDPGRTIIWADCQPSDAHLGRCHMFVVGTDESSGKVYGYQKAYGGSVRCVVE